MKIFSNVKIYTRNSLFRRISENWKKQERARVIHLPMPAFHLSLTHYLTNNKLLENNLSRMADCFQGVAI